MPPALFAGGKNINDNLGTAIILQTSDRIEELKSRIQMVENRLGPDQNKKAGIKSISSEDSGKVNKFTLDLHVKYLKLLI